MTAAREITKALDDSPAVVAARAALGDGAWVVGGAIRDALAGREISDLDLAIEDNEERAARDIAQLADAHAFQLSEEFASWRVSSRAGWQVDVTRLRGADIGEDLAARDFTINAIAAPLVGGQPLDPHRGALDLEARVLRAVGERTFEDDPLRLLRAGRIGAEFGLEIEPDTIKLALRSAARAAEPAGERQFAELRAIIAGPAPLLGLELIERVGATPVVLPELAALRGVEQNPYHHLDVHGHTIAVLEHVLDLELDGWSTFGELAPQVSAYLEEPLADELSRGGALRLAAVFHDLGKPPTRTVTEEGRIMFLGHDRVGAGMAREICTRLRTSRTLSSHLQLLARQHLRLGFLVHERPLPRRAVYDYLVATDPASLDVTLLTVADRLATQGAKTSREAVESHLDLAREMAAEALEWHRAGPPAAPIAGDELATALGIDEGPELGRLMEELEAARFAGEVSTPEEAVEHARRLL